MECGIGPIMWGREGEGELGRPETKTELVGGGRGELRPRPDN